MDFWYIRTRLKGLLADSDDVELIKRQYTVELSTDSWKAEFSFKGGTPRIAYPNDVEEGKIMITFDEVKLIENKEEGSGGNYNVNLSKHTSWKFDIGDINVEVPKDG